jgi:hypothetical protein
MPVTGFSVPAGWHNPVTGKGTPTVVRETLNNASDIRTPEF